MQELTTEPTMYERIVSLLEEAGPLSTYQVTIRLGIKGAGQALFRLRMLERRGRVERIEGDRPGWHKWRVIG